jgi:pyruvate carboxylase subunit B
MDEAPPRPRLRLTDTTFRDGNQSLLGGHLRGEEIFPIARKMDEIGFFAMEAFGGATFETYLGLGEDPWEYLRRLADATPKTPIQALVRGQNLVGHRNYPDDAVELFMTHAAACGVDVFRVFDPLNDVRNMEVAIAAARRLGKRVQGALCYALSPAHSLDLWCTLAARLAEMGVDDIVVKDTSGLLSPQVAWELVTALRSAVKLPIVVHSHCSSGMAPMAYMAGIEAGAAVVDTALSPLAWGGSQPATESVVAALAGGDFDTGLDLERLVQIKEELEALKSRHLEHLSPVADRVDSEILRFQMPAFMLEDLHRMVKDHCAEDRLREVLAEVPRVREDLGFPPLVAPLRQMIAAQALYNVLGGQRYATVTQELKDYLQGLYGRPPSPASTDVRRLVLGHEEPITVRPADLLDPGVDVARKRLERQGVEATDGDVLNELLFPDLAADLRRALAASADAEREQAASPDEDAEETVAAAEHAEAEEAAGSAGPVPEVAEAAPAAPAAEYEVEVEGEVFHVRVTGAGVSVAPLPRAVTAPSTGGVPPAEAPARAGREGTIVAPMQGLIVKVPVSAGDQVKLGDVVAVLEAMKMQNDIVATRPGTVQDVYVKEGDVVSPNQALVAVS